MAPTSQPRAAAARAAAPVVTGQVTRVVGLSLEVGGIQAAIGDEITVTTQAGPIGAEVVALSSDGLVCMPFGELRGVRAKGISGLLHKSFTPGGLSMKIVRGVAGPEKWGVQGRHGAVGHPRAPNG